MRDDGSGNGRNPRDKAPTARTLSGQHPRAPTAPPRTQSVVSLPRVPTAPAPRTQSAVSLPRVGTVPAPRSASATSHPRAASPASPSTRMPAMELGTASSAQQAQKQLLKSAFAQDDEVTQFDALLGAGRAGQAPDDEEVTAFGLDFDGETPHEAVTSRDLYKAIHPPVQSREGRRSKEAYRLVLDQFAVGTNPRYDPDGPQKPRAHIFAWDVSRAMGVEIPHFLGARELTLGQTVDWLRHEGPLKGWRRCNEMEAWEAANQGCPVVAVPKEVRVKLIALARPGEFNTDGKPALSAAALERGNGLSVKQAFNVFAVEFFAHA